MTLPQGLPIDYGVPFPTARGYRIPEERMPFERMSVGDSFLYPCQSDDMRRTSWLMAKRARNAARRLKCKFALRKTSKGVRVWRVA
jgi:hypothetical protein